MGFTFLSLILITLVFLFVVFLCIYLYFKHAFKYWGKRGVTCLQPSFPLGNFNLNVTTKSAQMIQEIYTKLKTTGVKYGGYYLLGMPFFLPLDAEICKYVITKDFQHFHDRGIFYDEKRDPLSAHLASLPGNKWKYLRNKLAPAFSPAKIKNMFPTIIACSTDIKNILESAADESGTIDIYDLVTRYASDVICSCAFGVECNSLKNPDVEFRKYSNMFVKLSIIDSVRFILGLLVPNVLKLFRISILNPKVTNFFYNIAKQTVEYREKYNFQRNDIMQLLICLKHNENIDDDFNKKKEGEYIQNPTETLSMEQIGAQVFFFFIAGFETSANTVSFCLVELAHNQYIQDKVRQEIMDVLKNHRGELTNEVVMNMKYMDLVLYETMRKYPPIHMLNRICTKSYKIPDSDLIIEEGTRVVISTLAIHHDPEYYPEPEKFDPQRFTEEEKAKRHPYTYLPFGDGPRVCMGIRFAMVEMKIALIRTLTHYKYSPDPRTKLPVELVSNGNMLVPKKLYIKLEKL